MKRFSVIFLVVFLTICLLVPVAGAAEKKKKKKKKKKPPTSSASGPRRSFDVAFDLGLPIAGFIPYGTFSSGDLDGSFSGVGSISFPYMGLHAKLYPARDWFLRFGLLNYVRQSGEGTYKFDDEDYEDVDFDWVINRLTVIDGAFGKVWSSNPKIRPFAGVGLGVHYVSFSDEDENDSASGWAIGPFGLAGVDFTVTKLKNLGDLFFGANLRLDLIWNWKAYEMEDSETEVIMGYLPITFFLSTGLRF